MGRPRKTFVDEGKANIIAQLIDECDIKTPKVIHDALKDLLGPTIQNILESELEEKMELSHEEEQDILELKKWLINKKNGMLSLVGCQSCGGRTPRNFTFDLTGRFLLCTNQDSDCIVVFEIDYETGKLYKKVRKVCADAGLRPSGKRYRS